MIVDYQMDYCYYIKSLFLAAIINTFQKLIYDSINHDFLVFTRDLYVNTLFSSIP